jgi:hypothetical protein
LEYWTYSKQQKIQAMSEEVEKSVTAVAKVPVTYGVAKYNEFKDFDNIALFSEYAQELLKAGFGNHTTKQGIMASMLWAKDHNFPIMDCIAHLTNIQGKVGADAHLIKAMIQRASIIDELVYDYRPVYQYQFKDTVYSQEDIDAYPDRFYICFTMKQVADAANDESKTGIPVLRSQVIDYETKIKFIRWMQLPNGEWYERIEYGIYKWSDAAMADLTGKDNWKKRPKVMIYWRAYTQGARRIADDLLLGVYEKTELMDAANIEYKTEDVDYLNVD